MPFKFVFAARDAPLMGQQGLLDYFKLERTIAGGKNGRDLSSIIAYRGCSGRVSQTREGMICILPKHVLES